jgi:predicted nucleic acid-binding protein
MHRQSLGVRIQQHTVDPGETLALAERYRLSVYDASYLWLARSMNVELVTLDDKLKRAARA